MTTSSNINDILAKYSSKKKPSEIQNQMTRESQMQKDFFPASQKIQNPASLQLSNQQSTFNNIPQQITQQQSQQTAKFIQQEQDFINNTIPVQQLLNVNNELTMPIREQPNSTQLNVVEKPQEPLLFSIQTKDVGIETEQRLEFRQNAEYQSVTRLENEISEVRADVRELHLQIIRNQVENSQKIDALALMIRQLLDQTK